MLGNITKKRFLKAVINIYGYENINYLIYLRDALSVIIKQRFDNKDLNELLDKQEGIIQI